MDMATLARKNRKYYLSEQRADKGDNPWFRYVKTMDSYSEVVLISPKMAQELLDADKDSSMRKPTLLPKLKDGESHKVSISFSGRLLEGQVILQAIVKNSKSAMVHFTFNVSDKLSQFFG